MDIKSKQNPYRILKESIRDRKYDELTDIILKKFTSGELNSFVEFDPISIEYIFLYCFFKRQYMDFLVLYFDKFIKHSYYDQEFTPNAFYFIQKMLISFSNYPSRYLHNPNLNYHCLDMMDSRNEKYGKNNIHNLYKFCFFIMDKMKNTNEFIKMSNKNYAKTGWCFKISPLVYGYIHNKVLDTAIVFRGSGLPSLVVEHIASFVCDTSMFKYHELINIIKSVLEDKPGKINANKNFYDGIKYNDL